MKFGVREICDVVLKAKSTFNLGNKRFYKGEPVLYFDTLKTSSLEGQATTVYAQGGKGNARLIAWDGERTVTFTMEDALISPESFMVLSGAGLIEAGAGNEAINIHKAVRVKVKTVTPAEGATATQVTLDDIKEGDTKIDSIKDTNIYIMRLDAQGEIVSEPYIGTLANDGTVSITGKDGYTPDLKDFKADDTVLVDFYEVKTANTKQINISPDSFGTNFYLEASTLFRTTYGADLPAIFVVPNCKIQSNFTFTMASSGDPSTFTFTMDAFPDYTMFDTTKKVLAAIQIVEDAAGEDADAKRTATAHNYEPTETAAKITKVEK